MPDSNVWHQGDDHLAPSVQTRSGILWNDRAREPQRSGHHLTHDHQILQPPIRIAEFRGNRNDERCRDLPRVGFADQRELIEQRVPLLIDVVFMSGKNSEQQFVPVSEVVLQRGGVPLLRITGDLPQRRRLDAIGEQSLGRLQQCESGFIVVRHMQGFLTKSAGHSSPNNLNSNTSGLVHAPRRLPHVHRRMPCPASELGHLSLELICKLCTCGITAPRDVIVRKQRG
ncbi:MAG: hypothetical protein WBP59_05085 [Ilumatobacteraceae bacterium]